MVDSRSRIELEGSRAVLALVELIIHAVGIGSFNPEPKATALSWRDHVRRRLRLRVKRPIVALQPAGDISCYLLVGISGPYNPSESVVI